MSVNFVDHEEAHLNKGLADAGEHYQGGCR